MVNEYNVKLSSLAYTNKEDKSWGENGRHKAGKNVRSANIFTFKVENQGTLFITDQIRNEYVSVLLKITETMHRGTKILM